MPEQVRLHAPDLSRWVHFSYASPSHLHFGPHIISSQNGTQQGDPLGMLLCCLALHPTLQSLQNTFQLPLHLWYADDGNLITPRAQTHDILHFLHSSAHDIGLSTNLNKTSVSWPSLHQPPPLVTCAVVPHDELSIVGSPIGRTAMATRFQRFATCLELFRSRLIERNNPQLAQHILRCSIGES